MSSLADRLLAVPPWLALLLIFVIPAAEASIFVGLFFPGELIILLGGVLANQDKLPLWSVIAVGSAGAPSPAGRPARSAATTSAMRSAATSATGCWPGCPGGWSSPSILTAVGICS